MADGSFPGLVSRSRDLNSASNVIFNQLADDAGNVVTVTGGKLDVNADVTVDSDQIYIDDSAFVVGTDHVSAVGMLADETAPDSIDEGDIGIPRMTLDRKQLNVIVDASNDANRLAILPSGRIIVDVAGTSWTQPDDSGFSIGGGVVTGIGMLADEVSTDSVDEGDIGIPRMTLNRKQIISSDYLDEKPFTLDGANSYVTASGFYHDDTNPSLDQVAEGDIGLARMSSDRKQLMIIVGANGDGNRLLIENGEIPIKRISTPVPLKQSYRDPLFVQITNTGNREGISNVAYATTASLAADTSTDHQVTASGDAYVEAFSVSSSGSAKFVFAFGPTTGKETTVLVGFLTGRQGDTKHVPIPVEPDMAYGDKITLTITNRQGQAADVYSTLFYNDIE